MFEGEVSVMLEGGTWVSTGGIDSVKFLIGNCHRCVGIELGEVGED